MNIIKYQIFQTCNDKINGNSHFCDITKQSKATEIIRYQVEIDSVIILVAHRRKIKRKREREKIDINFDRKWFI